ncbi:MAG: hypothetical protein HY791_35605 [Deltaproteobacteria bacterium]|nr:hypothetical protein [Deltaproteobacteria bacterium]
MSYEASRTVHAQQALDISELLSLKFADKSFGTRTPRKLKVTAPDGPSTGGGKRARQSIILVPAEEPENWNSGESVPCGWLDAAQKQAELKSFDVLASQYHQRHGRRIDIDQPGYDLLLADIQAFLKTQAFTTKVTAVVPQKAATTRHLDREEAPVAATNTGGALWGVVGFVAGFIACYMLVAFGAIR